MNSVDQKRKSGMRGGIRPQGKNSWQIQVYTGATRLDGRPERRFVTVHGRRSDAEKKKAELLAALSKGVPVPVNRLTVKELMYGWLEGYAKTRCSPRTVEGYKSIIDHHLVPAFGHLQLKDLQAPVIQAYYGRACDRLSKRTVHYHHRLLSEILKYAVRQGILGRNPCEFVDPPSPRGKKMRTMTPDEVEHLLGIASRSPYYPVIYTALNTGMRQAELLGLTWRAIDLVGCSISVSQALYKRRGTCEFREPKTPHSRRCIPMTPKLALFLKSYKSQREGWYSLLGSTLSPDDLVFATERGKPIDPSVVSSAFHKLVKQAGLEGVRFHDCRHTFASLMLLRGVSPKVVSEMLGHASAAFTMDTYQHIINGMQQDAVAQLDAVLPAGVFAADNAEMTRLSAN